MACESSETVNRRISIVTPKGKPWCCLSSRSTITTAVRTAEERPTQPLAVIINSPVCPGAISTCRIGTAATRGQVIRMLDGPEGISRSRRFMRSKTPNAKLSDCRRKRKAERERRFRIAAVRRAERRGGSSSPASGSAISCDAANHVCPNNKQDNRAQPKSDN